MHPRHPLLRGDKSTDINVLRIYIYLIQEICFELLQNIIIFTIKYFKQGPNIRLLVMFSFAVRSHKAFIFSYICRYDLYQIYMEQTDSIVKSHPKEKEFVLKKEISSHTRENIFV